MKFRVEREPLGEAVAWVARALPARPVVPVLSGLLLEARESGLTLSCFDYEVSARVEIAAEVAEPGSALVPGRLLADITRSLPPLPAEFSSVADMVGLSCGNAEFTLVSLPVDEYPAMPEPPAPAGVVDGGALAAAAAQVVPAASRDDTLPILTAVCLDIDGAAMTLAATDRYRLAVSTVDWAPAQAGLRAAALVPARTLADVARTMTHGGISIAFTAQPGGSGPGRSVPGAPEPADSGPGADPRPSDGMISFEGGGRRLTARLLGGEFIRYAARFPAEFGGSAELPAGPFSEAVRRVSLVAERASPVQLTFSPDRVTIEAHAEGRARAVESVPARFSGQERVISFNPHFLLDGLAAAAIAGAAIAGAAAASAAAPAAESGTGRGGAPSPGAGAAERAGSLDGGRFADGAEPAESVPGRIRLQFTSAAKPALITWAGQQEPASAEAAAGETPAFRYLVVPLRAPARA